MIFYLFSIRQIFENDDVDRMLTTMTKAKNDDDDEADNADESKAQVYREHRLLSLSTEGLLEVAAFKVFVILIL